MNNEIFKNLYIGKTYFKFIGSGNIWVEDSIENRDSATFCQYLIAEALKNTTAGRLEVFIFDHELTGLAAPFQQVNNGGEKILHIINDRQELTDNLKYLHEHISSVLNVIQGRSTSLLEFENKIKHKIDNFKLVILSTDYSSLTEEARNSLSTLIKSGPYAGVTFIIHSMVLDVSNILLNMFQRFEIEKMLYMTKMEI